MMTRTPMPALGLGTYKLTGEACRRAVAEALALGYRHIDTARFYGNEAEIGAAIRQSGLPRGDLFITTKVWRTELAPDRLRASLTGSLADLGLDHVDLLMIHWADPEVPMADTLGAMIDLVAKGRVGAIGVSNFTPALLAEARQHAPIACNQVEYHPFLAQTPLLAACRASNTTLAAYCPLARGLVSQDPTLIALARAHGRTPAQIALAWLLHQPGVAALPKGTSHAHLIENIDVLSLKLDAEEIAAIDGLARGQRLVNPPWAPIWG